MRILQRVIAAALGLLLLAAVFVFTSIILAALIAVGLVAWGWLWWRTRALRHAQPRDGVVVEGEFRDVTPAPRLEDRDRP